MLNVECLPEVTTFRQNLWSFWEDTLYAVGSHAVHCHHDIAANTPQNACHNGLIFNHIQWHAGCSGRRTA